MTDFVCLVMITGYRCVFPGVKNVKFTTPGDFNILTTLINSAEVLYSRVLPGLFRFLDLRQSFLLILFKLALPSLLFMSKDRNNSDGKASLKRNPTRSRRVVGSNPIWGSDFFRVLQKFLISTLISTALTMDFQVFPR